MYLRKARDGYLRWGADGKVRQLEARYPRLGKMADARRRNEHEATSPDQQLDVAADREGVAGAVRRNAAAPNLIERLMTHRDAECRRHSAAC